MIKKFGTILIFLITSSCSLNPLVQTKENSILQKTKIEKSITSPVSGTSANHEHDEVVPEIPPIKPETPAVVKIDNLKPAIITPSSSLQINLGSPQNLTSGSHSSANSDSPSITDTNNQSSGTSSTQINNQLPGAVPTATTNQSSGNASANPVNNSSGNSSGISPENNLPVSPEQKVSGDENINSFENIPVITDIFLTETGQSIVGKDAPASIIPNYNGKEVSITINGNSNIFSSIKMEQMQFSLQPPLILQTQIGKEPKIQVLIDNSILLTPVSVSPNSLVLKLDTKDIPDLYLEGLHKFSLVKSRRFTSF